MKSWPAQSPADRQARTLPVTPWPAPPRRRGKRGRLERIREMGIVEIAYRGQQEARKLIERLAPAMKYPEPAAVLRAHAPALSTPDAALHFLRKSAPARFFAGLDDAASVTLFRERMPESYRAVIAAAADTIIARRVDLLGYRDVPLGDPIDWHREPVSGRRAPLIHWSQIKALDPSVVGDSKVVWELNRHQWLVTLAQAWALTGDERYAEACIGVIDSWLDANPPGIGINWASSLEVSYRLIAWCWVLLLIRDAPQLSGDWVIKVLAASWQHASHIARYLSYYFSPNTHLTGEALGLFYAGTLLREFIEAPRWRGVGMRVLVDESERQISPDGVHFEQSTCYQHYTIDIYQHFLLLADRNAVRVPNTVSDALRTMVEFLLAIRYPNGSIPAIGDEDGGHLMPVAARQRDAHGVFATAAAVYDRPDFAWAAGGPAPELLWLLGSSGLARFDMLEPTAPAGPTSRIFPVGGYAVMRDGWDRHGNQLIVDIGPIGCPISSAHGHADLLGIQCAVRGEPCLIDPGNYCYTADAEWRDYFRSTWAHSTVVVDGRNQAEPAGPFGWRHHPHVLLREWRSDPELDFLDAEHDAYTALTSPVVHRRRVIYVKPRYWLIVDDLIGTSAHRIDLVFQFPPAEVSTGPDLWAGATTPAGPGLWIRPFGSRALTRSVECGTVRPIRGWTSPSYGQRDPAPSLNYTADTDSSLRILTLLLPEPGGLRTPPDVRPLFDSEGLPDGLLFERSGESVLIEGGVLLQERG